MADQSASTQSDVPSVSEVLESAGDTANFSTTSEADDFPVASPVISLLDRLKLSNLTGW